MIYLQLFINFLLIGIFTFGGGYAMIPMIKDIVLTNNWMSLDEFTKMIGLCECTPGPIAINMATYVGNIQGGVLGSVISTFAVSLPSFIVILIISIVFSKFIKNKYFKALISGVLPVALALILSASLTLTNDLFINFHFINNAFTCDIKFDYIAILFIIVLLTICFEKLIKKKASTFLIIGISAISGLFFGLFQYLF